MEDWSDGERLGRVCKGSISLWSRPSANSQAVGTLYDDAVVVWLREVIGEAPGWARNRRWVETPNGYLYSPRIQPVFNRPNQPVKELPDTPLGKGMWAHVTVPFVNLRLENPPARGTWAQNAPIPRFYYSQVVWVDNLRVDTEGNTFYRINERYGPGDLFWARAEAFRPMTAEEMEPINPQGENKKVVVDLARQVMSCMEDGREVHFCRISSGAKFDAFGNPNERWQTPVGTSPIWRKLVSHHMAGGTSDVGWSLPGIAWTTLFSGTGVAVHSTYWHNDFGTPRSRGCINATEEDARWVFRWTNPIVTYDMGDKTVGMPGGTPVQVVEN